MAHTPNPTRKLAAGVAAVVLTLAAAGAAVAVNLDTARDIDTPAGNLAATELVSDETTPPQVTPSTIYVDVPVPAPPGSVPAISPTSVPVTSSTSSPIGSSFDDDRFEDEGHDSFDDDRSEDHDEDEDHDDDRSDDDDHEDGSDDDD